MSNFKTNNLENRVKELEKQMKSIKMTLNKLMIQASNSHKKTSSDGSAESSVDISTTSECSIS